MDALCASDSVSLFHFPPHVLPPSLPPSLFPPSEGAIEGLHANELSVVLNFLSRTGSIPSLLLTRLLARREGGRAGGREGGREG
jgi:hypothetical protein